MEVRAIAANCIDLAGGTLDPYLLYLFEDRGYTVKAISVWSKVVLRTREDEAVHIYSQCRKSGPGGIKARQSALAQPVVAVWQFLPSDR